MSDINADLKSGWLLKKSPNGLPGFRVWQRRWFVLGKENNDKSASRKLVLRYFKEPSDAEPLGSVPVKRIVGVTLLPAKRKGCRFDLKVDNSRVYALDADSPADAKSWVKVINEAIKARNRQSVDKAPTGISGGQWTKFQDIFFKLKFEIKDDDPSPDAAAKHERATTYMNTHFTTDSSILRYLISNVLDPTDVMPEDDEKGVAATSNGYDGGFGDEPADASVMPRRSAIREANILHDKKLRKEGNVLLAQGVQTTEFLRNLLHIFGRKDPHAHGLALRILWIVLHNNAPPRQAAQQFAENVQIFCSESKFTAPVRNTLYSILFQENEQLTVAVDEPVKASMKKPFIHPLVLPAIFFGLKGSSWSLRVSTLEDINSCLIGSNANCESFTRHVRDWQQLVYMLLTDIPRQDDNNNNKKINQAKSPTHTPHKKTISGNESDDEHEHGSPRVGAISPRGWGRGEDKENHQENEDKSDEDIEQLQRKAYGYAMNIFAVLHYQSFADSREFYTRMCATLDALMSFAGPCESAQMVALVILQSLTNKLNAPASKKLFSVDDKTSVTWTNLVAIMQIIRIYTFHTVNWRTQHKDKKHSYSSNSMKLSSGHKNESQFSTIKPGKVTLGMKTIAESKENGSGKYKFGQETGVYVLEQARTAKNASIVPFLESEEYGVHFLSDGSPADLTLVRTLLAFLKSLKLDTLDLDSSPNMSPEDVQFAKKMFAEYHFLESSVTLLSSLNRSFIDEQKLTWRYLSNITQRFLAAESTRQRNGIIEELSSVLDGSRVIQTLVVRPKGQSLTGSMFTPPTHGETNDGENPEGETDQGEGEGEGRPGRSGNYGRTMKRGSSHKKKSIFGGNRREGAGGSGGYGPDRTPTTPSHHGYMSPQHHHNISNASNPLTPRLPLSPHSYPDDDTASNVSTPRDMTSNSISPRDMQLVSPSYGNTPHMFPNSPYSPASPSGYGETPRGSGMPTPFAISSPNHYPPTPLKLPATSTSPPGHGTFQLDGSHSPVFPASAFSPRSSPPPQARYMNNKHHGEGERNSHSSEGRGEGEPHEGEGEGYPPMQYQQQQQQQHSRPYVPPLSQAQVLMSQQSFHQQPPYSPPQSSQYAPPQSQALAQVMSQAHKRHISMHPPPPPPAEVFEDEYEIPLPAAPRPPPQPQPQPQAAVSPRLVSQPPPHLRQHYMRT